MIDQINKSCESSPEDYFELRNINGKQVYACKAPGCNKEFRYKSEATRHSEAHTNIRPFPCEFLGCNKAFKRMDALESHRRTHTRETPYKCTFAGCGKEFINRANLRYHVLKHEGGNKIDQIMKTSDKFLINSPTKSEQPLTIFAKDIQIKEEAPQQIIQQAPQITPQLLPKIDLSGFSNQISLAINQQNELLKRELELREQQILIMLYQQLYGQKTLPIARNRFMEIKI